MTDPDKQARADLYEAMAATYNSDVAKDRESAGLAVWRRTGTLPPPRAGETAAEPAEARPPSLAHEPQDGAEKAAPSQPAATKAAETARAVSQNEAAPVDPAESAAPAGPPANTEGGADGESPASAGLSHTQIYLSPDLAGAPQHRVSTSRAACSCLWTQSTRLPVRQLRPSLRRTTSMLSSSRWSRVRLAGNDASSPRRINRPSA
jgi:hypothetical protein